MSDTPSSREEQGLAVEIGKLARRPTTIKARVTKSTDRWANNLWHIFVALALIAGLFFGATAAVVVILNTLAEGKCG